MFRRAALVLLIAVVLCLLFANTLLGAMGSFLVKAEPPSKADVVLVLAGDSRGNRILKAAELVKEGYAPKAVISGPDGEYGHYECDLAIPFAVKAGYPESYFVHLENMARSTRDEARVAVAELRKLGVRRVLIVTSDYHTRRAGRMYREEAPDLDIHVVAAPDKYFSADGWWQNREGRKVLFMEWAKTLASWVES
jgi:uncharacterized SAM-binding protein YcdF (DUF218 family)